MLTQEIIKANEALTGLTEAQLTAITELSKNDEETTLGRKIGEMHGRYEQDVREITGIEKNGVEKSYDYVKRVLGSYKEQAGSAMQLQQEISSYKQKVSDLETQIASGSGDMTVRQKLKDAESRLSALQTQYESDKQAWVQKETDITSKMTQFQVDAHFEKAVSGLKFKAGYPETVQTTLMDAAKAKVLEVYKPDWVVEANGKKTMVFRDAQGEIARNRNNALNPYTATELISEQLKDVLDTGKKQPGAGTVPGIGKPAPIELVDVSLAKTQVEADDLITKYLLQQGEVRGTSKFADRQKEIRKQAEVEKLPIR